MYRSGQSETLVLVDFAPAIRPPAEGWELVWIEGVVGVDVALLSKNKIAQSSIEMEMEKYASARFARPKSSSLNLKEVVSQLALKFLRVVGVGDGGFVLQP